MYSLVTTSIIQGIKSVPVYVEADVSDGMPLFEMVGFLSAEVKEAKERVRTALKNCGILLPAKRITINFIPANIRKTGSGFDLPVVLAILSALGLVPAKETEEVMVVGEISLNGDVKPVNGILPMVAEAKERGMKSCIVPEENVAEALLVKGIRIFAVKNITEMIHILNGGKYKEKEVRPVIQDGVKQMDFADIHGQRAVKRACEAAVSGMHNLLMIGPPGAGKTMVAMRIPTILPLLDEAEQLELSKIYSVSGMFMSREALIGERPFRCPHHTVTPQGLVGGGRNPKPGEISLAHKGVLFLDELPEFQQSTIEILRQPMEDKSVRIVRNSGTCEYPADFMLVAAMNPCKCGYYPDVQKCSCTPGQIQKYLGKISQPFLDRMDICIETPKVVYRDLDRERKDLEGEETSETIRRRVTDARNIQRERYKGTDIRTNAVLGPQEIGRYVELGERERKMMELAFERIGLTARTYHKILRVARTIADLDHSEKVKEKHLKEAIAYRALDKKYWGR